MVEISLPPKGYLARDLAVSSLFKLGNFKIKDDIVEADVDTRKLEEIINDFRQNKFAVSLVSKFKRNFGKQVSYILDEDVKKVVNEFFTNDDEDYSYTLLLPELMEAERWYGGYNGKGKSESKKSINISKQSALLASIGFSLFTVFNYRSGNTEVLGLAPVDTIMQYQRCNVIENRRISVNNIDKLSHMGRIFLFAMHYSDNVCQKLVMLSIHKYRAEIIEDDSFISIKPIVDVWRYINSKSGNDVKMYERLISDSKLNAVDTFNKIANYVFEAVSGIISPDELAYFVARDTYLKDEALGFITPWMVKRLKEGAELAVKQGVYSA